MNDTELSKQQKDWIEETYKKYIFYCPICDKRISLKQQREGCSNEGICSWRNSIELHMSWYHNIENWRME